MQIRKLLFVFVPFLITIAVWLFSVPKIPLSSIKLLHHLFGGLALTGLAIVFVLSAKTRFNDFFFGGLGNVYKLHKYVAIFSICLILVHGALGEFTGGGQESLGSELGSISEFMFGALALISIFGRKLKYESWRFSHRLMLIAVILAIYHSYTSSYFNLLTISPLGLWTLFTSIVALVFGIYSIFIYQRFAFGARGRVSEVKRLGDKAVEVSLEMEEEFDCEKGQYVFLKVFAPDFDSSPHPFSVTFRKGNIVKLTIKSSGDFTDKIVNRLEKGIRVTISRGYGRMDFDKGPRKQLWIAGGIGITPFIGYLQDGTLNQTVDLYYSFRGQDEAIYREFLENYQKQNKNFHITFIDTSKEPRLNLKDYPLSSDIGVYISGPHAMVESFKNSIKEINPDAKITSEGFRFR